MYQRVFGYRGTLVPGIIIITLPLFKRERPRRAGQYQNTILCLFYIFITQSNRQTWCDIFDPGPVKPGIFVFVSVRQGTRYVFVLDFRIPASSTGRHFSI